MTDWCSAVGMLVRLAWVRVVMRLGVLLFAMGVWVVYRRGGEYCSGYVW